MRNVFDSLAVDPANAEILAVAAIAALIVLARRATSRARPRSSN